MSEFSPGTAGFAGSQGRTDQATAWAIGIDALAKASAVAAAATDEAALREGTARALAGQFADWVLVDLMGPADTRTVAAGGQADPELLDLVCRVRPADSPLISSAIQRGTPVVYARIDDDLLLGTLPGGGPVTAALAARSVAVGPITAPAGDCGAITVVRCQERPYLGFRELGVLAQIADLVGAAAQRLRSG